MSSAGNTGFFSKANITNLLSIGILTLGYFLESKSVEQAPIIKQVGWFALSGAITNWLAVHMLFERVPGLYGSGVIVLKFKSFKLAIENLIMNQFFDRKVILQFLEEQSKGESGQNALSEMIDKEKLFSGLLVTIQNSSFGGMLSLVGGVQALEPLREPFGKYVDEFIENEMSGGAAETLNDGGSIDHMIEKIETVVKGRLAELTPEAVKNMVADVIREHLGWLVVWGGVFGGIIGLLSSLTV